MQSGRTTRRVFLAASVGTVGAVAGCLGGPPIEDFRMELRAYDPTSGQRAWTRTEDGNPFGTIVGTAAGKILTRDRETIRALSAEDGESEWSIANEEAGALLPDGDTIHLPVGDELRSIDGETGEVRSRVEVPRLGFTEPAVTDDGLYVRRSLDDGPAVRAIGPDGEQRWETTPSVPENAANIDPSKLFQRPPIVVGEDRVFVVQGTALVALDRSSGEQLWTFGGNNLIGSPAVDDGTVFVTELAGEERNGLVALDAADGSREWVALIGLEAKTAPVLDDALYVLAEEFGTAAFDPASGALRWSTENEPQDTRPLSSRGAVVTGVDNSGASAVPFGLAGKRSYVEGLEPGSGEQRWSLGMDGLLGRRFVWPRSDRLVLPVFAPPDGE